MKVSSIIWNIPVFADVTSDISLFTYLFVDGSNKQIITLVITPFHNIGNVFRLTSQRSSTDFLRHACMKSVFCFRVLDFGRIGIPFSVFLCFLFLQITRVHVATGAVSSGLACYCFTFALLINFPAHQESRCTAQVSIGDVISCCWCKPSIARVSPRRQTTLKSSVTHSILDVVNVIHREN